MTKTAAFTPSPDQAPKHAKAAGSPNGRRIQTRRSGVHGKGVYALVDLAEGEMLIEYVGEVITWDKALERHPHDPTDPNHTFYFHIDEEHVIDAKHGGNSSRWINHSCKPNCEAEVDDGRVFIRAKKNIEAGKELFYDYGLVIDEPFTPELIKQYPCWCGAKKCRGTLLSPPEKIKAPKKVKKAEKAEKENRETKAVKESKKAQSSKNDKPNKQGKESKPV